MSSSSRSLLLTERDLAVIESCYRHRQLTRVQLERLHFAALARCPGRWESSVALTRLRRLTEAEFLSARALPVSRPAGRPALVYAIGKRSIDLLARLFNLPADQVRKRQREDSQLSFFWFPHRSAIADCRIAFTLACRRARCRLSWETDEEIARRAEVALVDGKKRAVRPDGFFTVHLPGGQRTSFFLEVQLQSSAATYRTKCETYYAYYQSGRYQEQFSQSLRVLGVTDTQARAENFWRVTGRVAGSPLFWTTTLAALSDPFASIWLVGGSEQRAPLLPALIPAANPAFEKQAI